VTAVSVVMAVYNGEAFLDASVQSILRQTLADIEFVIVDDGSTAR
jgi:glycosyltransferase involved in cell wall biosynthesis